MQQKKIGEILIEKGALKPIELETALEIQAKDNSMLGKILVGEDYVRNFDLHKAIAERFGLEFVDLIKTAPDHELLKLENAADYFASEFVPFRQDENSITIAVTNINEKIKTWAASNYPNREVKFVITSPYDIRHVLQQRFSEHHDEEARLSLWKKHPIYSARRLFASYRPNIIVLALLSAFTLAFAYSQGFISIVLFMNFLFLSAVSFKLGVFLLGQGSEKELPGYDKEIPVYTILLPLYREMATLPKLINAIKKLDYPKAKLDVKFVVEADDHITINAIKNQAPPQYMEIIAVPFSLPRTKPKACNYALNFARGEFVTIYDAEDLPHPSQLKTVLAKFAASDAWLACVQARLNYYNYNDNILTRWFALEYATWFDSVMKGLERAKMPIPLGGTSNHVRTDVLKQIGGWDAFNVTEDADLGLRLAQEGYCTETVDSLTLEEAPNNLGLWIRQRTRWIKGFMQTYFVHMRDIRKLKRNIGLGGILSLQFLIGIPVVIYLTSPILLVASLVLATGEDPVVIFPQWLTLFCWFNFCYGVAAHIFMCLVASFKAIKPNGERLFKTRMIFSCLTYQFYALLYIVAAFRALYQLITDPHYWEKTTHGLAKTGT